MSSSIPRHINCGQCGYVEEGFEHRCSPIRIQRKRTKGWKMPKNTVYVGRPTYWGNKFLVKLWGREEAIRLYREFFRDGGLAMTAKEELKGKNLACWCPLDQPCHADVLLEIANG